MSIEIRQMTIKSTLISDTPVRAEADKLDIEALKQAVIDECREIIEQSLDELQER